MSQQKLGLQARRVDALFSQEIGTSLNHFQDGHRQENRELVKSSKPNRHQAGPKGASGHYRDRALRRPRRVQRHNATCDSRVLEYSFSPLYAGSGVRTFLRSCLDAPNPNGIKAISPGVARGALPWVGRSLTARRWWHQALDFRQKF